MNKPTTIEVQPLVRGTQPEPLHEGALNSNSDPTYGRDWRAVALGFAIGTTMWVGDIITSMADRQDLQGKVAVSALVLGGLAYAANWNLSRPDNAQQAPQANLAGHGV